MTPAEPESLDVGGLDPWGVLAAAVLAAVVLAGGLAVLGVGPFQAPPAEVASEPPGPFDCCEREGALARAAQVALERLREGELLEVERALGVGLREAGYQCRWQKTPEAPERLRCDRGY